MRAWSLSPKHSAPPTGLVPSPTCKLWLPNPKKKKKNHPQVLLILYFPPSKLLHSQEQSSEALTHTARAEAFKSRASMTAALTGGSRRQTSSTPSQQQRRETSELTHVAHSKDQKPFKKYKKMKQKANLQIQPRSQTLILLTDLLP